MNVHKLRPDVIDPTGQRSFPNASIETKMIVEFVLERSRSGSDRTIKYDEIETLISQDPRANGSGYKYLTSARRILLRDHAILLDAEAKVGVRICTNEEKIAVSGRDLKKARRAVGRSRQKLGSVEYERLSEDKKRDWNARMSLVGALNLMTEPRAIQTIDRAVQNHPLPSAATLALFK